jgi:hypothetical protein
MTLGLTEIAIVVIVVAFAIGLAFRAGIERGKRK